MNIMFRAIDENYKMPMQYDYACYKLQMFGQFRDKRIWENFTCLIDWMKGYFNREKLFKIMGKSYNLDDYVLCRIPGQTWLMSNIFRHVENPRIEEFSQQKYIGKVRFRKICKKYAGPDYEQWKPPKKSGNGNDIEERKSVDDIEIVVFEDDDMRIPRRYELEHGWEDKWIEQGICYLEQAPSKRNAEIYRSFKDFEAFKQKWNDLKKKIKVPSWYCFNPESPSNPHNDHNMMKNWDNKMFDFLKEQKWMKRIPSVDCFGNYQYEEKSEFVVDSSQLLGIGGEGIVIQKAKAERVGKIPESQINREFEALKIIPIMTQNSEDAELFNMKDVFSSPEVKNAVKRQAINIFITAHHF